MDDDRRLLVLEMEEKIDHIFSGIESLRTVSSSGKTRRQLLEEIFRAVHSLKATAAAQQMEELAKLAHEFENLLHSLRLGRVQFDNEVLEVFEETADTLFEALSDVRQSTTAGQSLLQRLNQMSSASPKRERAEAEILVNALPAELWQSLSDSEKFRLQESVAEGGRPYLVSTQFKTPNFDRQFQQLRENLERSGELISVAPVVDAGRADTIDFRILYCRQASLEEVESELSTFSDVSVMEVPSVAPNATTIPQQPFSDKSDFIRVSLDELDRLISAAYVLLREADASLGTASGELNATARKLRESYLNLTSSIVALRVLSIDRVLRRAVRAGRTAARSSGKDIDFVIEGSDLMLDKSLCDAISDPLIHLVRNAVDHGIEEPAVRMRSGKTGRARVTIRATTTQGQPRVAVIDDGRGIDPDAITAAAVRLGIEPESSQLSLERSLRMIFRPGFSTTETVSDLSGRGVGLDVVEKSIEQLGGEVRVSSEPGSGSCFEILLPVTFGLLETVVVRSGNRRYLLDADKVLSIQPYVSKSDSSGEELFELNVLLGHSSSGERTAQTLLLCEALGERKVTLLVDEVETRERVLIRSLGSHAGRWYGIAGATELHDGTVVLLLDLPRLVKK